MKHLKDRSQSISHKLILLAALISIGSLSGCKLPGDYRGTFAGAGVTLKIGTNKALLTLSDGRKIQAKATELDPQSIAMGKPGIYVQSNADDPNELDIFWINPSLDSRRSENDFVWMDAEVVITRMQKKQPGKAHEVTLLHCEKGQVMVDLISGLSNGGCPAGTPELRLERQR